MLLQQARATSTQIQGVRFVTRSGVRVLIDSAAGIVIALLIAFSLIALGAAATMLAATTAADVQRRLPAIGVQRAIGFSRARIAGEHAWRATRTGALAGAVGIAVGAIAVRGAAGRLLEALNEQPPGWALLLPLAGALLAIVAVVAAAAAWPAWRATARPTVALLRGAEVASARRLRLGGGFAALGARLALARRGRAAASIAVLAVSAAVVLLMLGLASLVAALRDDPGSVGKRYDLTARLPADRAADVRALPGVADAAPRYVAQGADSFALGEPVKLVAFPGDHTRFEDPPLDAGRRLRRSDEAEVGVGLAQALGIGVGSTLAVQLPSGGEARFRVVGTVARARRQRPRRLRAPARVLAADPGASPQIVVKLDARRRPRRGHAAAGDARRAARRRRRRHDAQRRLPRHAGRAAARRWRSSTRSCACMRWSRASASWPASARRRSPCCARPAPRASPSAPCWPERRWPSRCPPRSSRSRSSASCSPRSSGTWPPATPTSRRSPRRARPRWPSAGWRCWASWRPPGSRAGRRAAPPAAGAEGGVMRAAAALASSPRARARGLRRQRLAARPARAGRPSSRRGRTPTATAS